MAEIVDTGVEVGNLHPLLRDLVGYIDGIQRVEERFDRAAT
jgi:hypothetical protein